MPHTHVQQMEPTLKNKYSNMLRLHLLDNYISGQNLS